MSVHKEALLRVHAGCCNGHEVDLLMGHYGPQSRAILDGHLVGEGRDGVRDALQHEFAGDVIGRVLRVDGEPVLVGYHEDGGQPCAIMRFEEREDRVSEVRIDHNADVVRALVLRATR